MITTIAMKTTMVEAKVAVRRRMKMIYSGNRDESRDVILAFIDVKEDVERPATTRSGRSIARISEIDFSFF